jgi:hypothetical protein
VLNFATEAWTLPNHKAYNAITVHFERKGAPISMILDIVEVAKSHSGVNLAEAFAKVLEEFGIQDKVGFKHLQYMKLMLWYQILGITCDNASNNDKMIEHLSTLIENFPGAANQTRCFSHILNLVAKSILRQFDVPKKDGDGEDLDDATMALEALAQELEDVSLAENMDEEGSDADNEPDEDENSLADDRDGMSEEEMAELEASLAPIRMTLTKVL